MGVLAVVCQRLLMSINQLLLVYVFLHGRLHAVKRPELTPSV